MKNIPVLLFALALAGCDPSPTPPAGEAAAPAPEPAAEAAPDRLETILAAQPDAARARYRYRNPRETLEFFGIEPGMTVIEALPGGGWYSRILVPYLGAEGRLVGANYAHDMWPLFGFFDDEFIATMATWTSDWPEQARTWGDADVAAFDLGSLPEGMAGQADAALVVRALHNLARFEDDGGYLTAAIEDIHRALKPGGIVGVVQHEARPEMPDAWANGSAGYLKRQFVIDHMTAAGFEFVESSDVNQNPDDRPTTEDVVWRLPPSLMTSGEDPGLRAEMEAIGESNRMTLKFRKP